MVVKHHFDHLINHILFRDCQMRSIIDMLCIALFFPTKINFRISEMLKVTMFVFVWIYLTSFFLFILLRSISHWRLRPMYKRIFGVFVTTILLVYVGICFHYNVIEYPRLQNSLRLFVEPEYLNLSGLFHNHWNISICMYHFFSITNGISLYKGYNTKQILYIFAMWLGVKMYINLNQHCG